MSVRVAYTKQRMRTRQLVRTYCIAQGTLLNALWSPKWEGSPERKVGICICMADSSCCAVEELMFSNCGAGEDSWESLG